jgi:glutaredoxin
MTVKKVVLYTANERLSALARNYLIENNVSFEEIDATKEKGKMELAKLTKQVKTPVLYVKRSHSIGTVIGFGEFQYASALNPSLNYDEFERAKKTHVMKGQEKLDL